MTNPGRARATVDDESFVAAVEAHRRDILLLCYDEALARRFAPASPRTS